MTSGMVSRWPVLVTADVTASDLDADRRLTEAAVERVFDLGRKAYFALCTTFDPSKVEVTSTSIVPGVALDGDGVTVSVSVVEVYPESFTMDACVRPAVGDGIAARARASLRLDTPVTDEIRDEFIALAHAAHHWH